MFFLFPESRMSLDSFASTSSASSCSSLMTKVPTPTSPTTFEPVQKKKAIETQPTMSTMSSFVMRTSTAEKHKIDKQIAKAIFATNSSFRCIENLEVKKAIQLLRPGYTPPSRKTVATSLLDEIYEEEKEKYFSSLSGQSVNMSIDGWSNVHNEPVICATITTEDGQALLYETIDTSGNPHTSEYLTQIVCDLISSCELKYKCTVKSFVTDNAANMTLMRKTLEEKTNAKVITYGCSAHIFNLLCKDFQVKDVIEHVVQIVKYFRNNHLARAKFSQAGGSALVLPSDVRWNSLGNCLEMYVTQWDIILKICEENKNEIDSTIYRKVSNIAIKHAAQDYLNILKPISVALDTVQRKNATIADTVEQWKHLQYIFDESVELPLQKTQQFNNRYKQALTPYHFIAYMLNPQKTKYQLTPEEKNIALETIKELHENNGLLPLVIKLNARSAPFKQVMFSDEVIKNVNGLQWWLSQNDEPEILKQLPIIKQFLCATASSASVERVFSSFGLVHSDIRNRLGIEKGGKLVFLFKLYNENE